MNIDASLSSLSFLEPSVKIPSVQINILLYSIFPFYIRPSICKHMLILPFFNIKGPLYMNRDAFLPSLSFQETFCKDADAFI